MASALQDGDAKAGGSGATVQGGGKKKKNKNRGQLLRQRLGARMCMANAHARKVAAEVHAQCIPPLATVLLTAARSRNS